MPRKLIAAQVIVVLGLVALVYFTLLRSDDGGPPQVVDAPGEEQARVQDPSGPNGGPNGLRNGAGSGRDGGPTAEVPGGAALPGIPGSSSFSAPGALPGGSGGAPGTPGSPPPGEDPDGAGNSDGDGDYGPGDDQYGNAITQLQARMGIEASPSPAP